MGSVDEPQPASQGRGEPQGPPGIRRFLAGAVALGAVIGIYGVASFAAAFAEEPFAISSTAPRSVPTYRFGIMDVEYAPPSARLVDSGAVVRSLDGQPLEDVEVRVYAGAIMEYFNCYGALTYWTRLRSRTDAEGRFLVWERSLENEMFRIGLEFPGLVQVHTTDRFGDYSLREDYRMAPTEKFQVRVVGPEGEPCRGFTVAAKSRIGDQLAWGGSGETNFRGEAHLWGLAGWPLQLSVLGREGQAEFEREWAEVQAGSLELVVGAGPDSR